MGGNLRNKIAELLDQPLLLFLVTGAGGVIGFVASFLALVESIGWLPVLLATYGGLTTGGLIWYWAAFQRESVHPRQLLLDERARYEYALSTIANRGSRTVIHHSATVTYEVGRTPDLDLIREEYVTSAGDPKRPLQWMEMRVNPIGADVPRLESFRELRNIQATQTDDADTYNLPLLAAGHTGTAYRGLAIFSSEIRSERLSWTWSCNWAVWNPLRKFYRDSVGIDVLPTVTYEDLEIHVILPGSALKPRMRPEQVTNKYVAKLQPRQRGDDRWTFVVKLQRPSSGYYSWALTVEGFD